MPKPASSRLFVLSGIFLILALANTSCSTTKDGFVYRVYHNTTAHFNGHFNAGESVKKGVAQIRSAHEEDYDKILPIFIYGTEETAKSAYPDMEKAIGKCEKVIGKHTMTNDKNKSRKHPKFNKWIDDNYMLIGQAYFYKRNYYKSEEVFQFVNRKYKEKEVEAASATWLARTLIAREEYSKALQALNRVEIEQEEISDELKADYYLVSADNLLHQEKLPEAAEKLETALTRIKRKKDRARPHFILAQIYQQLNRSSEAQREYEAVIHSRPVYELEFYSRINKALSYSRRGGSSDEIRKELMKMLRDEKNIAYRDQIYYALGDIALEEQHREEAIGYFKESLKASTTNVRQKAKTFLRLADLNFDQREYTQAQVLYDSTFVRIDDTHPRYAEIKARAESLTDLVGYLETIALNDSLISLCGKSPEDREKALRRAQKQIEDAMALKREEDEKRAAQALENAVASVSGSFWAYNATMRTQGEQDFRSYWGDRPLKDNWRLQSRVSSMFDSPDESIVKITENTTESTEDQDLYKVPSLEELRSDLPCDDDQRMLAAKAEVAEAYYQAGVIYKENLDDDDNAINSWEQLILNVESSEFHPVSCYQLHRTWLSKEQLSNYKRNPFCETCDSQYWADYIRQHFPGSDWAKLVDNPEYMDIQDLKESDEIAAYEIAYRAYTDRNYPSAISICSRVISEEPDNHLICKYRLLRAICIGYSDAVFGISENYQKELIEVRQRCPESSEAERANELLSAFNSGGAGSSADPDPPKDEATGQDATVDPEVAPKEIIFEFNAAAEHYFTVIVPTQGANVNAIKASIADFNTANYASSSLKVTNNLLNKDSHLVLVKPFKTIDEAKDYASTFKGNTDKLESINSAGYESFLISKPNYIQLFKSKDLAGYLTFHSEHY